MDKSESKVNKEKPLVVSYLRWSTGKQKFGDSERRQLESADDWLNKNDYEVNEDFILKDDGKSGYHSENFSDSGALGKFISKVKKGKIPKGTILLIEDFSRFSRAQINRAQQKFLELINNGICVYVVKDDKLYQEDNYSFEDMIVSLAKMASAHEESDRKSNHLKKFWSDRRQKAIDNSKKNQYPVLLPSNAPDWLTKVEGADGNKYFQVIEERATVIRKIFSLADEGGEDGMGLGSTIIVRILDREGVKPFVGERKNSAKTFNDGYITRLLRDRRLIGEYQPHINPVDEKTGKRLHIPNGLPISNYFPPVIDQDTFDRTGSKIDQRKRYQSGKVSRKFSNLFTKLVKCSFCGSSMTLFTKKGSKAEGGRSAYLQCSEGTKLRDKKRCGNKSVRYFDTFEKTIIQTLMELDLSHLFTNNHNEKHRQNDIRSEIYQAKLNVDDLDEKIKNATRLQIDKPDDQYIASFKEEYIVEKVKIEQKITELNYELASINKNINYQLFKDNLELVLKSRNEEDEIKVYNKRRSINSYMIDIIQYIAIDGVKQQAWVVFDFNHEINRVRKNLERDHEIFREALVTGKTDLYMGLSAPIDEEVGVQDRGSITPHLKIKLKRFKDCNPTPEDVMELRRVFEIAPTELVKINKICNLAVNKNWKKNRRINYQVLDAKAHDDMTKELFKSRYNL